MQVPNDSADLYRYFDRTEAAESLYACAGALSSMICRERSIIVAAMTKQRGGSWTRSRCRTGWRETSRSSFGRTTAPFP